jgi:pyrimidine deaminase RibD-like protein
MSELPLFDPNKKYSDRELMEIAVSLAEKSVPEDQRLHPMVGAVIARDGYVLQTGFRGESAPGTHAEEAALAKLTPAAQAVGATVYSTLEPCTTRGRMPCAQRLITRQVNRVCIGMLDPNPDIRGQGEWLLEDHRISIGKFEPDLVARIKAQNNEFIDYMRGLGVSISSPVDGAVVDRDPIAVRGTYRVHPRPGDNVVLFGRSKFTYYPQSPIVWGRNPEDRTWECERVHLAAANEPKDYGIVVGRVSQDFSVWLSSYTNVANITKRWIGAEMPSLPPGFEVLASVNVTRSARKP